MTTEKRKALFIEAGRNGYNPDQCDHNAMTVEDLIAALEEFGEQCGMDAPVFLRHDRGYTYGQITWDDFAPGAYDGDRVYLDGGEYDEEW